MGAAKGENGNFIGDLLVDDLYSFLIRPAQQPADSG